MRDSDSGFFCICVFGLVCVIVWALKSGIVAVQRKTRYKKRMKSDGFLINILVAPSEITLRYLTGQADISETLFNDY